MKLVERNKQIKWALSQAFGRKNVHVRGGRGTAYGWVHIDVDIPAPHEGECPQPDWVWATTPYVFEECDECRAARDAAEMRVWDVLRETGLINELGKYYDDFGDANYEAVVIVRVHQKEVMRDERA